MKAVGMARAGEWGQAGLLAIFALTFGGVGFGGIAAVLAGRRKAEDAAAREAGHPEAPWLWREDWAARRISDGSRTQMWLAWVFAALWNLVSLPSATLGARAALRDRNYACWSCCFPSWASVCWCGPSGRRCDTSATAAPFST